MKNQQTSSRLRKEIQAKQNEISDYLSYLEPRGTLLTNFNIIGGAFAFFLNGEVVLVALRQESNNSTSWVIPLLAGILSLGATIAGSLHKTQVQSSLPQFQKCAAKLEGLATLLDTHQVTEEAATKRFLKYVEECPSIPHRGKFDFDAVKGTICQPVDDQVVEASIDASGTVYNMGKEVNLWLTVEIDDRIWPKEGRIIVGRNGDWSQPVFEDVEDGVADGFSLSLWAANAEAHRKLRGWLEDGNRTRIFPGLRPLPGMRRLARISGLHRND